MRLIDHPTHKWRYSDSSYYDFICENCGVAEGTRKAGEPCPTFDIVATISEETEKNLKVIDDNIRNAKMNAHKFYCD